jgi:hypothetical protein
MLAPSEKGKLWYTFPEYDDGALHIKHTCYGDSYLIPPLRCPSDIPFPEDCILPPTVIIPSHQSSEFQMAEKRKGDSPNHKKTDGDGGKKRRRYNPRLQSLDPENPVRSRGRKPTKKYNPKAVSN